MWAKPIAILRRYGFQRGVLGGSRPWFIVAFVLWAGRKSRKALERTPLVAACEVLRPGDSIRITALPPEPKGRRYR
ncbi:MAG: hypothetical protein ABJD24_17470 [Acidimicrobiales bacterium]